MNIVITGYSKGIGWATAQMFASNKNNQIIGLARTKPAGLEKFSNIHPISFDLTNKDGTSKIMEEVSKVFNHVDVLINNGGALVSKPFEETNDEEWARLFEVNFFSVVRLVRNLLPALGNISESQIINISSMAGYQGASKVPGLSAYSSTKGALATLTESLAAELSRKNIRVNCICPGGVDTEMFSQAFPTSKAGVSATEMAEYLVNFVSGEGKRCTGQIIIPPMFS